MLLRGVTKSVACLLALVVCGCGLGGSKRAVITQYPQWDWKAYKRLAVVPFHCPADKPGAVEAAQQATYMLDDLLVSNGSFEILERDALKDVLTEQDLSQLADVADPSTIIAPGKIKAAQALVVGKITDFDLTAERAQKKVPVIVAGRKGRPVRVRERTVEVFRNAGTVGGSVRVIDAATGKILFAYRVPPIVYDDSQQGSPPRATPRELAIEAAKSMAVDCYKHVAPINTQVKLKGDSLIVALDYRDGEYEKTKKIADDLDEFLVVVRELPRECDRNQFRVALAPKEGDNFWEQEFTWSAHNAVRGLSWTVPVEKLRSAGAEKFEAKLYSAEDDRPLLKRGFELKSPDKD